MIPETYTSSVIPAPVKWRQYDELLQDGLNYISARATGVITSMKTSWPQFNTIGLGGVEWNSLYVIAARPGVGKTLIGNSLTRGLFEQNGGVEFLALHFQFEMLGRNMALRELSGSTGLDIRYIQSSGDKNVAPLTPHDFDRLKNYVHSQKGRREYVCEDAMTVEEMKRTIFAFWNKFKKPFVITLDHTLLVKSAPGENRQKTLENLATMMTEVKKSLPVIFFILTQLNREIDDADRQKPGNLSNFPTESDVFGSDFLLQCADVMIAYNRPAKYNINRYGPMKFILKETDKFLLAAHVLKNRFGDVGIHWYRAEYGKMRIVEAAEPVKDTAKFSSATTT